MTSSIETGTVRNTSPPFVPCSSDVLDDALDGRDRGADPPTRGAILRTMKNALFARGLAAKVKESIVEPMKFASSPRTMWANSDKRR
jgi:hypothetical protein